MTNSLRRWLLLLVPLCLGGCELGLDDPTLVVTPRIFAIVADHPELAPGQDVHVSVMAYDPMHRPLRYSFFVCLDTSTLLGTGGTNGTGGMTVRLPPCTGLDSYENEGILPGDYTAQLVRFLDAIPPSSGVDPALLRTVLGTAGLPITIRVEVIATDPMTGEDSVIVTGTKTIGITTRETPTTNPPFVYFHVDRYRRGDDGTRELVRATYLGGVGGGESGFECVPWLTAPATVTASSPDVHVVPDQLTLVPDDPSAEWEESFPIYDYTGGIRMGHEGAYYTWYTTGSWVDSRQHTHSSLHSLTTQGPAHGAQPSEVDDTIRNETWDVPREPGTYDLWLVLRDGHLGAVGCHTTIEVTPRP